VDRLLLGLDSRVAIVRNVEVRLVLKIQGKRFELELRRWCCLKKVLPHQPVAVG
jgi:hypothetical protein